MAPAVDTAEHGALGNAGPFQPLPQGDDRPADQQDESVRFGRRGFRPAEVIFQAGQRLAVGILGVERHRILFDQLLDAQRRNLAAAPAAGGEGGQQEGAVAEVDQALAGAGLQQRDQNIGRSPAFLLFLPRGRALARTASLMALCSPPAR